MGLAQDLLNAADKPSYLAPAGTHDVKIVNVRVFDNPNPNSGGHNMTAVDFKIGEENFSSSFDAKFNKGENAGKYEAKQKSLIAELVSAKLGRRVPTNKLGTDPEGKKVYLTLVTALDKDGDAQEIVEGLAMKVNVTLAKKPSASGDFYRYCAFSA